jgi:outer membrane receptor for ferrienterochelin and colicins
MRERSFYSLLVCLLLAGLTLSLGSTADAAQGQTSKIRVEVKDGDNPVPGATVLAGSESAVTDVSGLATLALPPGPISVVVAKIGYDPANVRMTIGAGQESTLQVVLTAKPTGQEEGAVVASTRINRRVEDQPVSVELLGRSRIDEQTLMTPGNIALLLDAMRSLRAQITSTELGTAMVRIRGLRGQYTRLLSDGVPLYFDHPGGLAPVQISPTDLAQVEVLADGGAALFGANAIGVVNLLSRRPGAEPEREFLFSQSAPNATDGVVWISSPPRGSWSSTYLFGGHWQDEHDGDDDGWSDMPGYSRGTARTRVFWDNKRGKSASGTAGVTFEKRDGGSAFAHQSLETREADGALFGQMPFGRYILAGAGTLYVQSRVRDFSDGREHDRRESATLELTLRGAAPRQVWIAGIAADWFAIRTPDPLASGSIAPRGGIFVHDDVEIAPWLLASGSARLDYTKGAGEAFRVDDFFFSPRASVLVRKGVWAGRFSAARSYSVPTTLTEETEAAGFARLSIEGPLQVETARSVSGDLTHRTRSTDMSITVFYSHLDHPALIDRTTYTLYTDPDPLVTRGVEVLGTVRRPPFAVTGTYAYLRARERGDIEVALTPRHSAGVIATAKADRGGRVGVQVYFTGEQRLDANPYRSISEPYVVVNLLGEYPFGRMHVFANAENLTDVRQTHWDPIARPAPDVDGRWTVDAWAPLKGRMINVGLKVSF